MPRAKFRCKRCKRSFKMAAHLARHKSTIHAPKKKKVSKAKTTKKGKRSTVRREVVRCVAASRAKIGSIRAFSTRASASVGIIDAMKSHQSELLAQRTSLDAQIDAFSRAMAAIGAASPTVHGPRTGRRRRISAEAGG